MTDYAVISDTEEFLAACAALAEGTGPVAVDVERASGFRYSQRAYLVQVFRRGAGVFLFDPPAIGDFTPLQSAIGAVVAAVAIALVLFPRTGMGLTFLVVMLTCGVAYEWCHYLVHTDYNPKTVVYRVIWRGHRLHHFKNEHYWFGVTTPGTADRVLRTYPDAASVPTSPTARNLHALDTESPAPVKR